MRRNIYKGRVVDLNVDTVTLPNGATVELEIIHHPGAVAIVPMTPGGTVLLIRQYRHAAGGYIYEVPAGKLDPGEAPQDCAARELEEFVEEQSGEEGLLAEAVNEKGKVTKGGVKDRLEALEDEPASAGDDAEDDEGERVALERCLARMHAESAAAKAVREAQGALDEKVLARYGKLTEAEVKTLVVEDKWLAALGTGVEGEVQRVTQQLTGRVKELEERYAHPLPTLEHEIETLIAKVEGYLKQMGLAWG